MEQTAAALLNLSANMLYLETGSTTSYSEVSQAAGGGEGGSRRTVASAEAPLPPPARVLWKDHQVPPSSQRPRSSLDVKVASLSAPQKTGRKKISPEIKKKIVDFFFLKFF